jgi:UDP-2-acetamido-3-amino-2,3-dideoxy-glucuronate N-acetyltransferase
MGEEVIWRSPPGTFRPGKIYGKFNDIHPNAEIGEGTIVWEWCRIGNSVIGKNCKIHNWVHIGNGCKVGDNCNIQEGAYLADNTVLGNDVFVAGAVHFTDERYPSTRVQNRHPVKVGDNVVIGNHAVIIGGVKIGSGSVVAALCKVARDIPPNQVWAGDPMKYIYSRAEYDRRQSEEPV